MTARTTGHPDPARADAGLAFFSTWRVGSPERAKAAIDAIAHAWEGRPWPHAGLLSYSVHEGVGTDEGTLMHHSQWRDEAAYDDFFRGLSDSAGNGRDERNAEIDAAVPGIERLGLYRTRRYRSGGLADPDAVPGLIVLTRTAFDAPDADRQRAWVDAVFGAAEGGGPLSSGDVRAHFHLSLDGATVVTYAEWAGAEAHDAALTVPGLTGRYRLALSLVPGPAA
ncbi:antibiotic biosynthesis monooxygenase [Streptomyces sp. CB01635]|uniref:antibiotic biosynthesis monooxygenase n=1 Tax=unclassified Streptomyces TaxID=2593676 RepID=UPI000C274CA1|nr:antibiotic biosynthesis monooxygenase [Streptomyces sp. CB01635]PJN12834.1 antibiotic biosynthesis monooxygenase [Streptomyces sp. CB01635]